MEINKQNYCVILAGGKGRRLWPTSRQNMPKQFLDIVQFGTVYAVFLDGTLEGTGINTGQLGQRITLDCLVDNSELATAFVANMQVGLCCNKENSCFHNVTI